MYYEGRATHMLTDLHGVPPEPSVVLQLYKKVLVRFQVLTAASMMFRIVFWDILPCKMIVDNLFTRQYIPEDNSEESSYCL
jgi:hypothetical protein